MQRWLLLYGLLALVGPDARAAVVVETAGVVEASTSVFVLDVQAAGVEASVAETITGHVAEAVHGLGDHRVVSKQDLAAVMDLDQSRALLGCEDDVSCLSQLADGLNAELLVSGTVGKVGTEVILSLSLVETQSAAVRQRVSGPLGEASSHPESIAALVSQLFGRAASSGPRFSLPEGEALSFAVLDLTAAGVSDDVATNLTQVLSAEIKRVEGASVIGKDDIAAMLELEADKAALGCSDSTECLAEIGGALGVERIIVGHVGKIAESYVVSLRLIATKEVRVENRVSVTFRGLEDQTLNAVRFAGRQLLGIVDDTPGTLALSSPHEGAVVVLDGKNVGAFPLRPIGALTPGRHELRVTFAEHRDLRTDVFVGPAETVSVWAELERIPDEGAGWVLWTVVGGATAGTLVLVAGGALVGYQLWEQNRTFPLEVKASLPARGSVE